jgi:hypothetical protein
MRESFNRSVALLSIIALFDAAAAMHVREAMGAETPQAAVQRLVEESGSVYAGDCAATVPSRDAGASCSKLAGEERGVHAFLVGRTFSEFDRWVFVARDAAGWQVIAERRLDLEHDSPLIPWP